VSALLSRARSAPTCTDLPEAGRHLARRAARRAERAVRRQVRSRTRSFDLTSAFDPIDTRRMTGLKRIRPGRLSRAGHVGLVITAGPAQAAARRCSPTTTTTVRSPVDDRLRLGWLGHTRARDLGTQAGDRWHGIHLHICVYPLSTPGWSAYTGWRRSTVPSTAAARHDTWAIQGALHVGTDDGGSIWSWCPGRGRAA